MTNSLNGLSIGRTCGPRLRPEEGTGHDPLKKLPDKKYRLWSCDFLNLKMQIFKNRSQFSRKWPKSSLRQAPELLFCVPRSVKSSGIDFWGLEGPEWTKICQIEPPKFPKISSKIRTLGSSRGFLKRSPACNRALELAKQHRAGNQELLLLDIRQVGASRRRRKMIRVFLLLPWHVTPNKIWLHFMVDP